jgi:hypothetical protein
MSVSAGGAEEYFDEELKRSDYYAKEWAAGADRGPNASG